MLTMNGLITTVAGTGTPGDRGPGAPFVAAIGLSLNAHVPPNPFFAEDSQSHLRLKSPKSQSGVGVAEQRPRPPARA
jgi:hypothetical protein